MDVKLWLELIFGFPLLLLGASYLVKGSASLALRFSIPVSVIGVTVVGFGTSFPELLISTHAAYIGNGDIAIGNVVGSNIANILLVLGASSLFHRFETKSVMATKEIACFLLSSSILILSLLFPHYGYIQSGIGIVLFLGILIYTFEKAEDDELNLHRYKSIFYEFILIIGSMVALIIGARWLVESGQHIALSIGISPTIVGLILLALGSSLPELFTSIYAAKKGLYSLALGNIVGSNLFNGLFILPIAGFVQPFNVPRILQYRDLPVLVVSCFFLSYFVYKEKDVKIWHGLFALSFYAAWIVVIYFTRFM